MSEQRTLAQLKAHYLIEKELADRLRRADKNERRNLYTAVYDELYRRVPDHPQLTHKATAQTLVKTNAERVKLFKGFLRSDSTYLEIGPGDCALAVEVACVVKKVYAVDVSKEAAKQQSLPDNLEWVVSDGCSIPVPRASIDVAYSDQLMEHLHPQDAAEQLHNIHEALKAGGVYICFTPNRLSGPHDISRYFDDAATGFHLKEYTTIELMNLFKSTGFTKLRVLIGAKGFYLSFPAPLIKLLETILAKLPHRVRKGLTLTLPLRLLLGVKLVATK